MELCETVPVNVCDSYCLELFLLFICRIMVLSEGSIIEFDTPSTLLESKGVFYNMAKDSNLVS